ncbi:MAG: MMPL family transporter [Eubacteriales bacterium]|nr:MMPL family transporter [Eubacteriales bacterium]
MNRFSGWVLRHRKSILILFILLAVSGLFFSQLVSVNYDMVDYLPADAASTQALSLMQTEFGGELPNARVMVNNVTVREALAMEDALKQLDGVTAVTWPSDVVGRETLTSTPVSALDAATVAPYYRDGSALFSVTVENGKEKDTVAAIRALIGDSNAVSGEAVNTAASQEMSYTEVINAMLVLLPIILLILILTTSSWVEPLLFLIAIGVAVFINMGTNLFWGEISFITRTVSPILQLAVSLDYAIFLLHSFRNYRARYEPEEAMRRAMRKSLPAIAASAATTVFGFLALMFMRFGIGPDLGLNLVKGVLLSFVSVMVFLPALTLASYRLIDRTSHRRFIPEQKKAGRFLTRISIPMLILAVVIVVPCFLAQSHISFQYGSSELAAASRAGRDTTAIEERFDRENALVLLVPKGDAGREAELGDALAKIPHVTEVLSYATTVDASIPAEYLSAEITNHFNSAHYARIILYADTEAEGTEAFATVQQVRDTAARYYDGDTWLAGQSATLYDMKTVVSRDTGIVNLCAVLGIFLVLLLTYRSLSIPLILLFTIESAIWLNLSLAYFTGQSFNFIGYLVVSTVQLGSTVDYAILLADRYLGNRRKLGKREAIRKALGDNLLAILTSAAILSTAGFTLAATSTNAIVAELGTLLGRGTLFSLISVACVLPALLTLLDTVIQKTSLNHGFRRNDPGEEPDPDAPGGISAGSDGSAAAGEQANP